MKKSIEAVYDIYLVPAERLADFGRGILGTGYPDACRCLEYGLTIDEVRERYRDLAAANYRRKDGEWDRDYEAACAALTDDEVMSFKATDKADEVLAKYLDDLTADPDSTAWCFEFDDDGKYVRILARREVGPSLVERIGDPDSKVVPFLVWRRGDYDSVRIVSALSHDVDADSGEEFCEVTSLAEVFGDGDGSEWWNDSMTDDEFRKLIDCTLFC